MCRRKESLMKKHSLLLMKIAVGLTILLGVLVILFTNEASFNRFATQDIQNVSKLSASIIYAEIDNSLTKPIIVGQTMASDLFLKNWLIEESADGATPEQLEMMKRYLSDYRDKYGYDSVSMISEKSGTYYYQDGINKVISETDAHDVWYYDFVNSGDTYCLNIDSDEAHNDQLTVFADCRITDRNGKLLGVVGIGIKMTHLQELMRQYENDYDLRAFLINERGLVQVDTVDENIETFNFFEIPEIAQVKDRIRGNKTTLEMLWYPDGKNDHCVITRYVENLNWYIVVEKDTEQAQQQMDAQINRGLLLVGLVIALVLLMISYVISSYNRMLLRTASIDDVTNLPNVKMFREMFRRNTKRAACSQGMVFMFDIDHFRRVNDEYGRMIGNTVLYRVSELTTRAIGNKGFAARWGRDEFVGVIYASEEEACRILDEIVTGVAELKEPDTVQITISLGTTRIAPGGDLDAMIREADTAMSTSRVNGRNQKTIFK